MSSTPMSPATGDEVHEALPSLASSPPSSVPSHSPPAQAHNDISDTMLAEEKRMKQARQLANQNARKGGRKDRKDAPAEDVSIANTQLDYLISQAQVSEKGSLGVSAASCSSGSYIARPPSDVTNRSTPNSYRTDLKREGKLPKRRKHPRRRKRGARPAQGIALRRRVTAAILQLETCLKTRPKTSKTKPNLQQLARKPHVQKINRE